MPKDLDINKVVQRIKDNDNLLEILIQMEDFLDSLDLYAFANWIDGVVVEGPNVSRYWVSMTLKYPYKKMPDPRGGLRLTKYDVAVNFEKSQELVPAPVEEPDDYRDGERKPKMLHTDVWLVTLHIPRRFIDEIYDQNLEDYDDEVDLDDVSDAEDEGLDDQGAADMEDDADPAAGGEEAPGGSDEEQGGL